MLDLVEESELTLSYWSIKRVSGIAKNIMSRWPIERVTMWLKRYSTESQVIIMVELYRLTPFWAEVASTNSEDYLSHELIR